MSLIGPSCNKVARWPVGGPWTGPHAHVVCHSVTHTGRSYSLPPDAPSRRQGPRHTGQVCAVAGAQSELESEAERFVDGINLDSTTVSSAAQASALPVADNVAILQQRCAELEAQVGSCLLQVNSQWYCLVRVNCGI